MQGCESYAVSEVVGIAIVLAIISGGISITLLWGVPYLEEKKTTISLDSALLQLDVMGDMIEGVFRDGINSSKTMNFKAGGGDVYLDPEGERFVFYYSIYKYLGKYAGKDEKPFEFDVSDFDPENADPYNFFIKVIAAPQPPWGNPGDPLTLNFNFTRLNDSLTDYYEDSNVPVGGAPVSIRCKKFPLAGAVRIDIISIYKDPWGFLQRQDCGRIWLFDVGSLNYRTTNTLNAKRAIVENGGVISAVGKDNGYQYNEPSCWSPTLLDNSNMVTMRIIQIVSDNYRSIGINDPAEIGVFIKAVNSTTLESRQTMGGWFKIRMYGDAAAVSAWRIFYQNRMSFYPLDEDVLWLNFYGQSDMGNFPLFSLNYAICDLDMEVKS